jgi:prolyl 4-hydroxylase
MKRTMLGSAIAAVVLAVFWGGWVLKYQPWRAIFGGLREEGFLCKTGQYTTEIVSVDPLLIYINNFVDKSEIEGLIAEGFVFLSLHPFPSFPILLFET